MLAEIYGEATYHELPWIAESMYGDEMIKTMV